MDASAFEGAVEFSTIYQETWEESHPPMNRVIGIQTSVLAVVLAHGSALTPLGHGPVPSGKQYFRQWTKNERAFAEIQVSRREVPAHHWNKNKNIWVWVQWRGVESWAARMDGGKRLGEWQMALSEKIKGPPILLTTSQVLSRSLPTSFWEHLAWRYPEWPTGIPALSMPHFSPTFTPPPLGLAPNTGTLQTAAARVRFGRQLVGVHRLMEPDRARKRPQTFEF